MPTPTSSRVAAKTRPDAPVDARASGRRGLAESRESASTPRQQEAPEGRAAAARGAPAVAVARVVLLLQEQRWVWVCEAREELPLHLSLQVLRVRERSDGRGRRAAVGALRGRSGGQSDPNPRLHASEERHRSHGYRVNEAEWVLRIPVQLRGGSTIACCRRCGA